LNETLKIKVASLKSPERIEEIAVNQLGMILPADVRYVYLQENEEKVVESQVGLNIKNKKNEPSYNIWADLGKKVSRVETFLKVPNGFSSSL
ncbi:MAG: hypothetical protein KAS39_07685, partial [Actinomycetia bacterium]|nr:hypothetical protein [Actinomycetes bacterium]